MTRNLVFPTAFFNSISRDFIGFDPLFELMSRVPETGLNAPGYPPYNVEKLNDTYYRIVLAVAGFTKDDIDITLEGRELTILSKDPQVLDDDSKYLYKGIGKRRFKRSFLIGEYFEITQATLQNGLLSIDLTKRIPEEMQVRRIEIT